MPRKKSVSGRDNLGTSPKLFRMIFPTSIKPITATRPYCSHPLVFSDLKINKEKLFFRFLTIERFLILSAFQRYPGPFGPTNIHCYIEVRPGWVAG